ncbi:MAG: bifunctional phosphoribosylaminoimidazolecarboxamide formyltransferase/IMP cyclohydrolase [Pirellulaceae bacterium]|nr:bifunctional phosphoribosylaminoimidazolecarboxamide formyltransferase/IMP cyclohydrolase [Planctomycetaceae bacterium]
MHSPPIRRALISVSNKLGLADFARELTEQGVEIFSTGGTRRHLTQEGIQVQDVAHYTGFPEMMDGRVKTLHPKIFAGILCRHDREDDMEALAENRILTFELVVVNLYPFEATISREGVTVEEAVEQIDIGGPSLVRAAAKNHQFTSIVTRPEQYAAVLEEIRTSGSTTFETRRHLAGEAFERTASYDRAISDYFTQSGSDATFPESVHVDYQIKMNLRYGENPHQRAAVYRQLGSCGPSLLTAQQLNGKELSYNNLLDLDSALRIAKSYTDPAAVVVKHNNPCGAAVADDLAAALRAALDGDPVSAFGSVLGFNRTIDVATAEVLAAPGLFIEAIVAPDFQAAAVGVLTTVPKWRDNVRLMQVGRIEESASSMEMRHLMGGMLIQDSDDSVESPDDWQMVTSTQPDDDLWGDLEFGWTIVRHIKSNAIAVCGQRALYGAGAGQMSRVDAVEIAIKKSGSRCQGAVLCSDAFFPFPDSIHRAAEAGIAAIIQPGGSRRDNEVIDACNHFNLPMVFTGRRHFKH